MGKVGLDYTTEQGADMARIIALELLATLKHELGGPSCQRCPRLRPVALPGWTCIVRAQGSLRRLACRARDTARPAICARVQHATRAG